MINRKIIFSTEPGLIVQCLPYFAIRPCPDNFPPPPFTYGHHPYFIDYKTQEVSSKKGIQNLSFSLDEKPNFNDLEKTPIPILILQKDENSRVFNETLTLTNSLSNSYFFDYKGKQHWTLPLDGTVDHIYGQEGYNAPEYESTLENFEEIPSQTLTDLTLFSFTEHNTLKKIKLNDILNLFYESHNVEFKQMFLSACVVLNKSFEIREIDLSASYLFMVSAIEALIKIEHLGESPNNCDNCGQPIFKVSRKFKDFIDKYGYEVDNKTKNKFYSMRSNIAHLGQLLELSNPHQLSIVSQKDINAKYKREMDRKYYESFESLAKICFRTFLYRNI